MAKRYSFQTYQYRMPKPLKTLRVSTPDPKGVFGQGAKKGSKQKRVTVYGRVQAGAGRYYLSCVEGESARLAGELPIRCSDWWYE